MATTLRPQPSTSSPDGTDRAVAGLIARLLLHYWTPQQLSDGARAAMAADWLDDLREFGPDLVAEACASWRRTQSRRPTPADIRSLAIQAQRELAARSEMLALPSPGYAEAERRRLEREARYAELAAAGSQITDAWARGKGHRDFEHYLASGGTIPAAWEDMQRNGVPTIATAASA